MFLRTCQHGVESLMIPIGHQLGVPVLFNFTHVHCSFIKYFPKYISNFTLTTKILQQLVELKLYNKTDVTWRNGLYGPKDLTLFGISEGLAIKALDELDAAIDREIRYNTLLNSFRGYSLFLIWETKYATTIYLPAATREYTR